SYHRREYLGSCGDVQMDGKVASQDRICVGIVSSIMDAPALFPGLRSHSYQSADHHHGTSTSEGTFPGQHLFKRIDCFFQPFPASNQPNLTPHQVTNAFYEISVRGSNLYFWKLCGNTRTWQIRGQDVGSDPAPKNQCF